VVPPQEVSLSIAFARMPRHLARGVPPLFAGSNGRSCSSTSSSSSSSTQPRFVALMGMHVQGGDQHRVGKLPRLLSSVERQTHRCPFLVSWSAESAADDDCSGGGKDPPQQHRLSVKSILSSCQSRGVLFALPPASVSSASASAFASVSSASSGAKRSQFQHYRRLWDLLRGGEASLLQRTFLVFSDDDDLWHRDRLDAFLAAAQERPEAEVLACRRHLSQGFQADVPLDASDEVVSRMLERGELLEHTASEEIGPGLFGSSMGEYFDLAVHWTVFDAFFRRHNDAVFENPFCDIRFRTFALRWPGHVYRFLPSRSENWMYFYDRPVMPYISPPNDADKKYLSADLPDISKIAGIRQTLDCVLFQLVPVEPPFRISAKQFAQELVGILRDQSPASVAIALDRCKLHGVEVTHGQDSQ